jgi:hypothetical protein
MDSLRAPRVTVLVTAVSLLAGCANVARPVPQEVRVETPGCAAARCELRNDQGAWVVETTPGSVRVITSKQPLQLSCSAQGQQAAQTQATSDLRPISNTAMTAGAVVGGGVAAASFAPLLATPFAPFAAFGIVVGAIGGAGVAGGADAASRRFGYPQTVVVPFQCGTAAVSAPAAAPLGLTVRGLGMVEATGAPPGAVLVSAVAPGGRAERAGLRAGDIVVQIDGRALDGAADLEAALRDRSTAATLIVVRGGTTLAIALAALP